MRYCTFITTVLKTDYDFNKFLNEKIVIKFYKPIIANKKEIVATLLKFDNETIEIDFNGKKEIINRKDMANVVPYIEF